MKQWLLFLLTVVGMGMAQTDHAPTSEQCKADASLWKDSEVSALGIRVVSVRILAMSKCALAYQEGVWHDTFDVVAQRYSLEEQRREVDFRKRHPDINAKWLKEDDAGLR